MFTTPHPAHTHKKKRVELVTLDQNTDQGPNDWFVACAAEHTGRRPNSWFLGRTWGRTGRCPTVGGAVDGQQLVDEMPPSRCTQCRILPHSELHSDDIAAITSAYPSSIHILMPSCPSSIPSSPIWRRSGTGPSLSLILDLIFLGKKHFQAFVRCAA